MATRSPRLRARQSGAAVTAPPAPPLADPRARAAAIRFVVVTIALNAIGFGMFIPVFPALVMELGGVDLPRATAIGGMLSVTYAVFQFVFAPVMGNLSDRYGRRPVLLGSLLGFAVDFLILALAPSLVWLFVARAFTGIFGATNGPAQSVIADIADPADRARLFGYISAAFGIGFVIGPAIGGLLGDQDHRMPFYLAAALAVANLGYGLVALPETLAIENRRAFVWHRANPLGALFHVRSLPGIVPLAVVYFLWNLASLIYPLTWSYFAIASYGWTTRAVGASLAIMGLAMALMQIVIAPRIIRRVGEWRAAVIGLTGAIATMIVLVAVPDGTVALVMMPMIAVQSLVHPCLTAMMSRRARADNQGELQGFAASLMAVGSVIAPLLYNPLLAYFTGPAAPFAFAGAALVAAMLIALAALAIMIGAVSRATAPPPASQPG